MKATRLVPKRIAPQTNEPIIDRKDVYTKFDDPSHGWLEVPFAELKRLKIDDIISPYSYQRGGYVYLEEDADLSTFWNAKQAVGEAFTLNHSTTNGESWVRHCQSYEGGINFEAYSDNGYKRP